MLQVYLVRHGETQWNAERRIQGQSDSPLTAHGERQAWQVGERARTLGITHIITSDLGRTRRTAEIIAEACGCSVIADVRLRELDMGVLEKRHIDSLSEEEEGWRRQLVNGTPDGRIPQGESMQELSERMHAALASCLELPAGSRPLLVSHGIALGCLVSTILGCRRTLSVVCGCATALFRASTISKARGWLPAGWWKRRATSRILTPRNGRAAALTADRDQILAAQLNRRGLIPAFIFRVEAFNIQPLATRQVQHRHAGAVDGQDEFLQTGTQPFIRKHDILAALQGHWMGMLQVAVSHLRRQRGGIEYFLLIVFSRLGRGSCSP